ncbi:MAG: methyltransferase family protein [Candidatus Hermodarchaeota archaeon]
MKGKDKLREKLPDYQGWKIKILVIIAIVILSSSMIFQFLMDSLPRVYRSGEVFQILAPFTPIIGSTIVVSIGFLSVRKFWRIRDKYLSKFGVKAYQKAFKLVIIGIPMLFSVIIHSFFPTDLIMPYSVDDTLNRYLGVPISELLVGFPVYILYIRLILAILFVGLGLLVINRSLSFFGIDYMALVYLFYPDESTLQNHKIYSILRHPTYHGLLMIGIGGIFFRFTIYSIIYFFIFLVGINIHIKFVEEKELIQRFGEEYEKYMEDVPAFFVKLNDIKKYFYALCKFKKSF